MRKSVRRALREACVHFRIKIPIFPLVLASENAALGGALETLLQLLRIHAAEEVLERGPARGEGGDVLGLELAEIVANRLHGPGARRQGAQQAYQGFVDPSRKIQG